MVSGNARVADCDDADAAARNDRPTRGDGATRGGALPGHQRADRPAPGLGARHDLEQVAPLAQHRARLAPHERDGLLGDRAERDRIEALGLDDMLPGRDEQAQLLDAVGRSAPLRGGVKHRASAGECDLQVALGLVSRNERKGLQHQAGRVLADAAAEQLLVEASALACGGHEAPQNQVADRVRIRPRPARSSVGRPDRHTTRETSEPGAGLSPKQVRGEGDSVLPARLQKEQRDASAERVTDGEVHCVDRHARRLEERRTPRPSTPAMRTSEVAISREREDTHPPRGPAGTYEVWYRPRTAGT